MIQPIDFIGQSSSSGGAFWAPEGSAIADLWQVWVGAGREEPGQSSKGACLN